MKSLRCSRRGRGALEFEVTTLATDAPFTACVGQAGFKDLLIYRSALNADEVAALQRGQLLRASLEVYSPLSDVQFAKGSAVQNTAQSLTSATVAAGGVQYIDR